MPSTQRMLRDISVFPRPGALFIVGVWLRVQCGRSKRPRMSRIHQYWRSGRYIDRYPRGRIHSTWEFADVCTSTTKPSSHGAFAICIHVADIRKLVASSFRMTFRLERRTDTNSHRLRNCVLRSLFRPAPTSLNQHTPRFTQTHVPPPILPLKQMIGEHHGSIALHAICCMRTKVGTTRELCAAASSIRCKVRLRPLPRPRAPLMVHFCMSLA